MRVILLADLERLGHEGEVVEVRDGYARNYLFPRGLARPATPGALRDVQLRRSAIERRLAQRRAAAESIAAQMSQEPVIIGVMVGERGRLHGRVTTAQIAQALQEKWGLVVDRRDIELREPIKAVGDYLISARLFPGVTAEVLLRVCPLGTGEQQRQAGEAAAGSATPSSSSAPAQPAEDEASKESPAPKP
jgi:large subunit ribosomal protein L9